MKASLVFCITAKLFIIIAKLFTFSPAAPKPERLDIAYHFPWSHAVLVGHHYYFLLRCFPYLAVGSVDDAPQSLLVLMIDGQA